MQIRNAEKSRLSIVHCRYRLSIPQREQEENKTNTMIRVYIWVRSGQFIGTFYRACLASLYLKTIETKKGRMGKDLGNQLVQSFAWYENLLFPFSGDLHAEAENGLSDPALSKGIS